MGEGALESLGVGLEASQRVVLALHHYFYWVMLYLAWRLCDKSQFNSHGSDEA